MQRCLRQLWFLSVFHYFELCACHLPREHNSLADALSRWHIPLYQAPFAQLTTQLGISYVFHYIPGDLIYFDVD